MPQIGDARTDRFFISMAEVRIGPLSSAFALNPTHSIGLLNSATVAFNIESVDLEAGLPRKLYDTQIISQLGTVSMEMREYTRRNMQMLLGYAPQDYVQRVQATLAAPTILASGNELTLQTGEGAQFAQGDVIQVFPDDIVNQGNVAYATVTGPPTGDVLTCGPLSLPFAHLETTSFTQFSTNDKVQNVEPIPIGANTTTQYFTAQVLGTDRKGNPIGFLFWKCALSSGLEVGFNADDFNTNTGELKILSPSAADLATGGDLEDVKDLVDQYPVGMALFGGDVA